jgi:outer membrane protein TolC
MQMKSLSFFVMLLLSSALVCAQNEYSLVKEKLKRPDSSVVVADISEAIQLLKKNNKSIRISKEKLNEKKRTKDGSLAYLLPTVEIEGKFIHNPEYVFPLNDIRDAIISTTTSNAKLSQAILGMVDGQRDLLKASNPAFATAAAAQLAQLDGASAAITPQAAALSNPDVLRDQMGDWNQALREENIGTLSVTAKWVLYAGGRISAAREAARLQEKEANQDLDNTINSQISDLVAKYYGSRLTNELVKVRAQVVDGMQKHFEDAQKLEKNGQISRTETLYAQMSYYDAIHEYKKAKNSAKLIQTVLKNSLGEVREIEAKSPLFMTKNLKPFEYYRDLTLKNNPILKKLETKEKLVEQGIKKQKGEFLPSVALFGNKTIVDHNQSALQPNWYVGVGMKLNLFKGTKDYHDLKIAQIKKTQVRIYQEKAESDLITYLFKTYQELENCVEEYEAKEKALEFAKEYLTAKEKAFKEGFAKSTDVVDARMNLSKSMIEQLKNLYQFDLALAKLLEISGISELYADYQINLNRAIYEEAILN